MSYGWFSVRTQNCSERVFQSFGALLQHIWILFVSGDFSCILCSWENWVRAVNHLGRRRRCPMLAESGQPSVDAPCEMQSLERAPESISQFICFHFVCSQLHCECREFLNFVPQSISLFSMFTLIQFIMITSSAQNTWRQSIKSRLFSLSQSNRWEKYFWKANQSNTSNERRQIRKYIYPLSAGSTQREHWCWKRKRKLSECALFRRIVSLPSSWTFVCARESRLEFCVIGNSLVSRFDHGKMQCAASSERPSECTLRTRKQNMSAFSWSEQRTTKEVWWWWWWWEFLPCSVFSVHPYRRPSNKCKYTRVCRVHGKQFQTLLRLMHKRTHFRVRYSRKFINRWQNARIARVVRINKI